MSDSFAGAICIEHEAVEVVHGVFGESGAGWVVHDAALIEGGGAHTALHALDETDVFGLKYVVDVVNRVEFGLGRFGGL